MRSTVKKWGNSAAVRIPASVLEAAAVGLDQPVDIREEQGRIIIEPLHPERYSLAALVAGITDANRHTSVDMGPVSGQEVWYWRPAMCRRRATLSGYSSTRKPGTSRQGIGPPWP